MYSIEGKDCYYNILMKKRHIFPQDLLFFEEITVNGKEYEVELNSYFVTDERPETLRVGETEITIGPLEYE